ncbi:MULTISPECIES: nSTAND1 domain-containing NTPase [unclassified Microcoleus]|uniref:WD40 domain-containing protein n=1 Tax=unclassified Microcoleus TaxID=2642155 RepID=UPI002FD45AF4
MNDSSPELIQINQESLKTLIRGITCFQEEFSLILAVCNYRTLREQIVQQLREQCPVQMRELVLEKSVQTLYTRIKEELGTEQPNALMIVGLESVRELDAVLTATNQIREEFRNFNFPVVLWVTDAILCKLIRLIPDFHSWATTVEFQMTVDELIQFIRQTVDEVFAKVLNSRENVFLDNAALDIENGSPRCAELKSACEELQHRGVTLDSELEAGLEFILGRVADNSDVASRQHYEQSLALWQQTGDRARCGLLLFYIGLWWRNYAARHRVEYQQAADRARDYFQQSIEAFEQADRPDLAAKFINFLAEVLHRLKHWRELELVAQKALVLHQTHYDQFRQARIHGFLAEVALSKSLWIEAKQAAGQALFILNDATETISNPSPEQSALLDLELFFHQGWYLFSLAKAQQQLGQLSEAIATLEAARSQTKPQYDPELYIQILTSLRENYFQQGQYLNAFRIKQERQAIESQFGFRAFIGAGRLQPKQQIANPALPSAEPQDEVAQEIAASGRLHSVERLLERIERDDCKLTIIHGESGVGKSSIEQAGLIPALKQKPINARSVLPVLQQVYADWADELAKCLAKELATIQKGFSLIISSVKEREDDESDFGLNSPTLSLTDSLLAQLRKNAEHNLLTILIFDQFEEFFFICKDSGQRKKFYDFLRACLDIPYVKVILSLREDYLHYLLECTRFTRFDVIHDNILDKNIIFYLGNFKPNEAKLVIQSLTERTQFELEPALIDELVKDLAGEVNEVRPVELQIVGAQLQSENITTLAQYQKKGPKAALVARFLEEVIKDCGSENKQLAELVLWLLTDENSTRPLRTRDDLKKGLEDLLTEISHLELVLEIFVKSGLVLLLPSFPDNRYQLVHDYLADFVRRQKNNELIEELEKERAQRKRSEAELNRVLKRQLKLAMAGGAMMAVLAVIAGIFGVEAKIGETNAELKQISANSESLWASNKELEALVEGLKAGKKLKYGWKIEPNTKNQVVSRLQEVVYNVRERNRLEGHTDTITDISFSPDGKFIASGSKDKTVKLWDRDGSEKKPALQGKYGNEFTSVAFSPDSQIIAAGNKDSKIYLWRLNGTLIKPLTGHRDWVTNIRFSPDGKTIVSASRDNSVRLWKIDGTPIKKLEGHNSTVNIVRFSPDGQRIASASEDGTIKLWSSDGKQLQTINSPGVLDLAFSQDSKTLSVASRDNTVKIWKIDGILLTTYNNIYSNNPFFACFSPDGKLLATFDKWNRNLWKIEGSKIERLGKDFRLPLATSGSFSPDAKTIALASKDNVVKIVSLDSETFDIREDGMNKSNIVGLSHNNLPVSIDDNQLKFWNSDGTSKNSLELADRMENVSFNRDGQLIALIGTQITTKLWNITENLLNTFELNSSFPEVSPDGKLMVTVERNNTAKLWRADGKLIGNLPGHKASITKVFFSPDSQLIATVSQDNIVKLWNQDAKFIGTLQGHTKKISEVIFSRDSQLIATVSLDNTVKLWNRAGLLIQTIEKSSGSLNRRISSDNSQVRFSPDSQMLFVPSNYNDVQLRGRNGTVIPTLKGHDGPVYSASFSPNSQIIATTSSDNNVKLWRRNGTLITTLPEEFYKADVSFSPDSRLVVSVNYNNVKLWGIDGKDIATLADNSDDSPKINFSPDSKTIILIAEDNVKLYNRAGRVIRTINNDGDDVPKIRVSQDGRLIASVDRNNVVNLWSSNGKLIQSLKGHRSKITLVQFSPDGKNLATADKDNTVKLWQSDGTLVLTLKGHGNRVERVDFGADGKTFAVSGVEDVVQLLNRDSKKIVATLKGHGDRINSVSFSPTSQLVASASDDKTVRLWDFDGNSLHILDKHTDKVNRVRFSPDGKILASASDDKTVKLWNLKGGFIKTLEKHKSPVRDVIFNPNSSKIASASDDSTVILWDYQSGKLEHRLSGHSASVKSLSFSPNGEMLASADDSGAVKIWSRDGIMLKSFNQESLAGDNISFNSDGQQIFAWIRDKENYYYGKPLLWSMNLNDLLGIGCQKARDYLNNNPNLQKNDRSLCD